jgi:indole-3-glycerol phosphate synthase
MNILDEIVEKKKCELATRKLNHGFSSFSGMRNFSRKTISLKESFGPGKSFGIIAEIKRASPSAGDLRANVNAPALAKEYAAAGAAGISVLTEESFFHGSLDDLEMVREAVTLPILRKDFIIDEYQVAEAKSSGADAILLIAAILDRIQLHDLILMSHEHGIECLVELYDAEEINKLDLEMIDIIGINNRDLRTFDVDINRTLSIKRFLPENIRLISESGIRTRSDIEKLMMGGVNGALVGETLLKAESPGEMLRSLMRKEANATAS